MSKAQNDNVEVSESSVANKSSNVTGVTKRTFMKGIAVGTGVTATGVGSMQFERTNPVQTAEAGLPALVGLGFGAGLATRYIYETATDLLTGTNVDKEDLDNYVGRDARLDEAYKTARQMESADDSVYTNLQNWLEDGWENAAWIDVKIQIVEAIENGDSQQEVEDKALTVLDEKASVPEQNFINHFSEQAVRFGDIHQTLSEHSEIEFTSYEGITRVGVNIDDGTTTIRAVDTDDNLGHYTHTLHNGDNVDLAVFWGGDLTYNDLFDSANLTSFTKSPFATATTTEPENWYWQIENSSGDWKRYYLYEVPDTADPYAVREARLWQTLENKYSDLEQEIILFVDELYAAYQSGDVNLDNVVGASEFEEFAAKEDSGTRAMLEMASLGVSVDLGSTGIIRLEDSNIEIEGYIGTRDSNFTITVGETYNPDTDVEGDVYVALNEGTLTGELQDSEYVGSLDGGVFELEEKPFDSTNYYITTNNNETAMAEYSEFEENADGRWEVDLSDRLEEPIADVEEVEFDESDASVSPDSIRIDENFTVIEYFDEEGNEIQEANFTERNTQTTNTDIEALQEELEQMRNLVDDWEDIQEEDSDETDGGSGGNGDGLDWLTDNYFGIPGWGWIGGSSVVAYVASKAGGD